MTTTINNFGKVNPDNLEARDAVSEEVEFHGVDGSDAHKDEALGQVGGFVSGGTPEEMAALKLAELKRLAKSNSSKGIDTTGDGQIDSMVTLSLEEAKLPPRLEGWVKKIDDKTGLLPSESRLVSRVVITESNFESGEQAEALRQALQAQFEEEQLAKASSLPSGHVNGDIYFNDLPASDSSSSAIAPAGATGSAATAAAASASASPESSPFAAYAQDPKNFVATFTDSTHKKHRGHKDGDDKLPYVVKGADGRYAFNEKIVEADKLHAARVAALTAGKEADLSEWGAKAWVYDVEKRFSNDPNLMLAEINSAISAPPAKEGAASAPATDRLARYRSPQAYAAARTGGDKKQQEKFEESWQNSGVPSLLTEYDQWAAVKNHDASLTGKDYMQQVLKSKEEEPFSEEEIKAQAKEIYTKDEAKQIPDLYKAYIPAAQKRIDAEILDLQHQAELASTPAKEVAKLNQDIAQLVAEKESLDATFKDALRNPKELEKILAQEGVDGFTATKRQKALARKMAIDEGIHLNAQVKTVYEEGYDWLSKGKTLFTDVKTVAEDIVKIAEKPLAKLETIKAAGEDIVKELIGGREAAPIEFVKANEKYSENYGKPRENSPGASLAKGAAAGTAPEVAPGNMFAPHNAVKAAENGSNGGKKRRTAFLEDEVAAKRAQRALVG